MAVMFYRPGEDAFFNTIEGHTAPAVGGSVYVGSVSYRVAQVCWHIERLHSLQPVTHVHVYLEEAS